MARILADTNIWLRIADPGAVQHSNAVSAVARLLSEGHHLCICAQNLIEFWAVATRPIESNGFGWTPAQAAVEISEIESRFFFLQDTPEIFSTWKDLVSDSEIRGKRAHDARLAAVCFANGIHALLTFNPSDFVAFSALRLLDPTQAEDWNLTPADP